MNEWKFYNSKTPLQRTGELMSEYQRMMIPPWLRGNYDNEYHKYISLVFSQKGGSISKYLDKLETNVKKSKDLIIKKVKKLDKKPYYVLAKK